MLSEDMLRVIVGAFGGMIMLLWVILFVTWVTTRTAHKDKYDGISSTPRHENVVPVLDRVDGQWGRDPDWRGLNMGRVC